MAGRADGEHGGGGAHPVAQRRVGTGEQVDQRVEPAAEAGEAVLARFHALHRGPVLLHEAEHLAAGQHDPDVAVQDLVPGLLGARLVLGPVQEVVDLREVVLGEAVDDVFLGLEVVVQCGLGHAQPFGDLAQRGLLVALLGEQLERDLLRPRPGVSTRSGSRACMSVSHSLAEPGRNLLDGRLVSSHSIITCRPVSSVAGGIADGKQHLRGADGKADDGGRGRKHVAEANGAWR